MTMHNELWNKMGIGVDVSRMGMQSVALIEWQDVLQAMLELEKGALANPDEGRQVGHYWLRTPSLSSEEQEAAVLNSWAQLREIMTKVHQRQATELVMIGIGGSALGPQLLVDAFSSQSRRVHFLDNTDPEGMDRVLRKVNLADSVVAVLSKSGGTKETRNAMLEAKVFYDSQGVEFNERAIAITVEGSLLHRKSIEENWLGVLPLWNWVGGRTSITGMVGLLPLAFLGLNWEEFISGASDMDSWTRKSSGYNPALTLAAAWHKATEGCAKRAMVALPYKDSLQLFSRYLQQLIMESLGKKFDLNDNVVHQGLTVYGNKGSTDQHAYVQQLREGPDDCFIAFHTVLQDREGTSVEVETGVTSGDYLLGFLIGTRNALSEAGRLSLTVVLKDLNLYRMGALIALYERAVGFYAERIGVNAYHQPGVEAGKLAAAKALDVQRALMRGEKIEGDDAELILLHLKQNGRL
ncbi:MAG: glucose-6-phosphate isomerase [Proteobacteria bacterium]|nr:glucose-6-phosphate isomerase [Pseudomonadota bacterium]